MKKTNYIPKNIVYIEKVNEGRNSIVHTLRENIECIENTSKIFNQISKCGLFVSPHISFLINSLYIHSIERYKMVLKTGVVLPIAEKKYKQFKNQIEYIKSIE